jgi:hypothetical protein
VNHHHKGNKALNAEKGAVDVCRHDPDKRELKGSKVSAGKYGGSKRDETGYRIA